MAEKEARNIMIPTATNAYSSPASCEIDPAARPMTEPPIVCDEERIPNERPVRSVSLPIWSDSSVYVKG